MRIPAQYREQISRFPAALRNLIQAELKAGNTIVEVSSCFPAPPAGAYVKLAKAVSTRARKSGRHFHFYDRNSSSYSGEFTDAKRFFFVLEPPHPPEEAPEMNAIRAALEAKQRTADEARYRKQRRGRAKSQGSESSLGGWAESVEPTITPRPMTTVDCFRESMVGTYERWHEGIGYDLKLLETATPEELVEIENLLLARGVEDWRDVEALAALDSPRARVALRRALRGSNHRVRIALTHYALPLLTEQERTTILVEAVRGADTYGGLTQALLEIESFHPAAILDALFEGVLRGGQNAIHFSAMLMYLHGKAPSAFDWEQRPFFLKFNTSDAEERRALFQELCVRIGVDPVRYLSRETEPPGAATGPAGVV